MEAPYVCFSFVLFPTFKFGYHYEFGDSLFLEQEDFVAMMSANDALDRWENKQCNEKHLRIEIRIGFFTIAMDSVFSM